jgi:hypothetical protein
MEIQDNGIVMMRFVMGDGEVVEHPTDLFAAYVGIQDCIRKALTAGSDERVLYEGLVDLLRGFGFPTVSWWAAHQWMDGVRRTVDEVKKKGKELSTPASPGSTESTPGG